MHLKKLILNVFLSIILKEVVTEVVSFKKQEEPLSSESQGTISKNSSLMFDDMIFAKVSKLRRVTVGEIRGGKNPSLIFRFLLLFPVQLVQVHKEYSAVPVLFQSL